MGLARWCLFIVVALGLSIPGGLRWHICGCVTPTAAVAADDESSDETSSCCAEGSEEPGGRCTESGIPCERCKTVGVEKHVLAKAAARSFDVAPTSLAWIAVQSPVLVAPPALASIAKRDSSVVPRPPPGAVTNLPLRC